MTGSSRSISEAFRASAFRVAYRILGSVADAEDIAQETVARLICGDADDIMDCTFNGFGDQHFYYDYLDCTPEDAAAVTCKGGYFSNQGTVTISGFRPTGMGNSVLKLRGPVGRLYFNMGLPVPVRRNPNIVTPPTAPFQYRDI